MQKKLNSLIEFSQSKDLNARVPESKPLFDREREGEILSLEKLMAGMECGK